MSMHATAIETSPTPSAEGRPRRVCGFLVSGVCFAVDAAEVAEVLRAGRLAAVPLAAPAVAGLLHLRGRIVPVVDTRRALGFPDPPPAVVRTHLVLRLQDDWYSLIVDEMLDVFEIPPGGVEHPTKPAAPRESVTGTYAGDERLVHLLDVQRIVSGLARQRVGGRAGACPDPMRELL